MEATGGLCTETEYPYTGEDGNCESSSCGTMYDAISGHTDVTSESEPSLEAVCFVFFFVFSLAFVCFCLKNVLNTSQ